MSARPASPLDGPAPADAPTPDEEVALWAACKAGAAAAREALFSRYLPFARQIAARHFRDRRSGDIEFADLSQLASAGLLEAIDHFAPALGVPFRGFARRRIAGSVVDGLGKLSEVRAQVAARNRLRQERVRSLAAQGADEPSATDALKALAELAVGLALGFMLEDAGVFAPEERPDGRLGAYESLAWKETVQQLAAEVATLPERDRSIIRRHYFEGVTFEDLGAELGLTKGRISQLHKAAIGLLRTRLRRAGEFRLQQ